MKTFASRMKRFASPKLWLAFGLVLLFFLTVSYREKIVRNLICSAVSDLTGAEVRFERFSSSLPAGWIRIEGLVIKQPPGYRGILIEIPEVEAEFDVGQLLKKKILINWMNLRVREAVLVRDGKGILNVDTLKIRRRPLVPICVGRLRLSIERVVVKDYTGPRLSIDVHELEIRNAIYTDLTSAENLADLIFLQTLRPLALKGVIVGGAAVVGGFPLLPIGLFAWLAGESDGAFCEIEADGIRAYKESLSAARELGDRVEENFKEGSIHARVRGTDVTIRVEKKEKTRVTVHARNFLMPDKKVACGVLYRILERLSLPENQSRRRKSRRNIVPLPSFGLFA